MITEQQRKLRVNGIGGSDCASILGKNKYKNIYELYLEKIGESDDLYSPSNAARRGNALEPLIIDLFCEKTGKKAYTDERTFYHKDYDFIFAHVDALINGESAILECKSARSNSDWGEEWSCDIPESYLMQVIHCSAVMNVEKVYIAVYFTLIDDIKIYLYEKDKELEDAVIQLEKSFWLDNVKKGIAPDIKDRTLDFSSLDKDKEIIADNSIVSLFREYEAINIKKKELEKNLSEIKENILDGVGQAGKVVDNFGKKVGSIICKNVSRFDSKKFKEEHQDMYSGYQKQYKTLEIRL